jgi:hypothetical protein
MRIRIAKGGLLALADAGERVPGLASWAGSQHIATNRTALALDQVQSLPKGTGFVTGT